MAIMYPPQNNSPFARTTDAISESNTTITVNDGSILPDAPNVLTIGTGEDAELVLVTAKTGNILTVTRGFNRTTAAAWPGGSLIYRAITAQDISALQENVAARLVIAGNAGFHNSIFTGRNLGRSVTAAQWAAIAANTFDDLFIGDYWTRNGTVYVVAAFNYYWGTGDAPRVNTPHVVLVPATIMYTAAMNASAMTDGGYVGSDMYTSALERARTKITTDFGAEHILTHSQYFINAVTDGLPTAGAWYSSTVDLMSEANVYGSNIYSPSTNGGNTVTNLWTLDVTQFPLFALSPAAKNIGVDYWLRNTVNAQRFAAVYGSGLATAFLANRTQCGVRPAFCICA